MKFDFSKSSQDSDLQNKFQYIYKRLDLLLKIERYNHELILKILAKHDHQTKLSDQVNEFYDQSSDPPDVADLD